MTLLQAAILGAVQGITEFLPISSSGHLILIPTILGWDIQNLSFDVALHFGSTLAVLLYFYREWIEMLHSLKKDVIDDKKRLFKSYNTLRRETKTLLNIIIVSIPVAVAGVLLSDTIEKFFRTPLFVSFMLIFISVIMFFADRYNYYLEKNNQINLNATAANLSFKQSLIMSISQIVALFPGSSRSGITISTGLFEKLNREQAAHFSFLLATPLIIGAFLVQVTDLFNSSLSFGVIITGIFSSFVVGYLAIKFLLSYLKTHSLILFVVYRLGIAVIIILIL